MGLGAAHKEGTSRMKNVSIESFRGKNYVFGLRKTVYSQKNSYIYIISVGNCQQVREVKALRPNLFTGINSLTCSLE
jgi:hypothetical protein